MLSTHAKGEALHPLWPNPQILCGAHQEDVSKISILEAGVSLGGARRTMHINKPSQGLQLADTCCGGAVLCGGARQSISTPRDLPRAADDTGVTAQRGQTLL